MHDDQQFSEPDDFHDRDDEPKHQEHSEATDSPGDALRRLLHHLPQLARRQHAEVEVLKLALAQPGDAGIEAAAGLIYLAYPENIQGNMPRSLVGDEALDALVDVLNSSLSSTARANAAWALGVVGRETDAVLLALIDALELDAHDAPDPAVSGQAYRSLRKLEHPTAAAAAAAWQRKLHPGSRFNAGDS